MSEAAKRRQPEGASGVDSSADYAAVRGGESAGLFDLSARGRIEVGGAEAAQFLNGLITNDVKSLAADAWMPCAFPNVQGRLLASARVVRQGERFLFDTEAATRAVVLKTLERFTLAGDFRVRDLTDETVSFSAQGAGAARIVRTLFGDAAAGLERGRILAAPLASGSPATLIRATHTAEDGFILFAAAADREDLWRALARAGTRAVGAEAEEVIRIEAGEARYGVDIGETNVVLEAVADEAVSFTKGCYVGQEIIARIHWRGHVAKKLAGLVYDEATEMAPAAVPQGGMRVLAAGEERDVGRLTSYAYSPRLKRVVALGVIKYDYLASGTAVRIAGEDGRTSGARIVELPHVRGSWFGPESGAESKV